MAYDYTTVFHILSDAERGFDVRTSSYPKELVEELVTAGYIEPTFSRLTTLGVESFDVLMKLADVKDIAYRKEHKLPLPTRS